MLDQQELIATPLLHHMLHMVHWPPKSIGSKIGLMPHLTVEWNRNSCMLCIGEILGKKRFPK